MNTKDLTRGSIPSQLWSLSWPMMLSFFFYTLYNIVDTYWVSKLSPEAIAAVSISQITLFAMISLGFGITVGSGVIMSMHIGARNQDLAERVLAQSFVLSAIMGLFFTVTALTFRTELLVVSGAVGKIFAPASVYFTIVAAGSILLFLMMAAMFAFNSQGDTHTVTKFLVLSSAINIVLDPLLIFGYGPVPALGIAGAAYATLISQTIFLVLALRSLAHPSRAIRFYYGKLGFEWESVKKVLDIGFPAALTQVIFPVGLAIVTAIASAGFAEPGAIAFSLGFRVEFFAYLPAAGFGFGAMAMMGQNIGAGNLDRARSAFNHALVLGFAGAAALGLLAAVLAGPIVRIFTDDPVVAGHALSYMRTVALSFGFLAATMIVAPGFQAIGRSWPGFWIFLLRVGGIAVPLSYLFTIVLGYSIHGIWIALILANVLSSLVGYFWIRGALARYDLRQVPIGPGDASEVSGASEHE